MGRRSPILGYNHNVRYRGVAFHVQTEDSGIVNPHIFTHLFHGGIIVSTRKLVYDPDADDGVIKSLMQAQHKAVMKELRRGLFDDKIDVNLRGTPGLLPRGVSEAVVEETGIGSAKLTKPSAATQDPALADTADAPDAPAIEMTAGDEPSQPEIEILRHQTPPTGVPKQDMRRTGPVDTVPPLPPPPPDAPPIPANLKRRPSTPPPMSAASLPPLAHRATPSAATVRGAAPVPKQGNPPPQGGGVVRQATAVSGAEPGKSEISSAFEQITAAQVGQVDDVAEIHSPAPGSAPTPPGVPNQGDRPGEYVHKRGDKSLARDDVRAGTGRQPAVQEGTKPPTSPGLKKPTGSDRHPAQPEPGKPKSNPGFAGGTRPGADAGRGSGARPPVSPTAQRVVSSAQGSGARPGVPSDKIPAVKPGQPPPIPQRAQPPPTPSPRVGTPGDIPRIRTPTSPRPFSGPGQQPPQRAGTMPAPQAQNQARQRGGSGGVVMSRPAVIVGGRSSNPTPAPPVGQAAGTEPSRTQTGGTAARIRRAREEGGRGVFGQDLISEKSLDEVILAYLSEGRERGVARVSRRRAWARDAPRATPRPSAGSDRAPCAAPPPVPGGSPSDPCRALLVCPREQDQEQPAAVHRQRLADALVQRVVVEPVPARREAEVELGLPVRDAQELAVGHGAQLRELRARLVEAIEADQDLDLAVRRDPGVDHTRRQSGPRAAHQLERARVVVLVHRAPREPVQREPAPHPRHPPRVRDRLGDRARVGDAVLLHQHGDLVEPPRRADRHRRAGADQAVRDQHQREVRDRHRDARRERRAREREHRGAPPARARGRDDRAIAAGVHQLAGLGAIEAVGDPRPQRREVGDVVVGHRA